MSARAAVAALALALSACSLSGLDRFERATCENDACCADLEDVMPTGDACLTWQVDPTTGYCEMLARDDDADGAPAPECADGQPPDCDDADGRRSPAHAEAQCDGVDEDCDGRVDEDAVVASADTLAVLHDDAAEIAGVFVEGARDEDEAVALAVIGSAGTRTLRAVASPAGMMPSVTTELSVREDGGGDVTILGAGPLASLGADRYALLVRPAVGCARWALATLDLSAGTITTGGEALDPGLPKPAGTCPDDASPVGPAAIAADDEGDLVVAWIADAGVRECGAAPSADVVVAGARIGSATRRVSASAITVGATDDASPPALAHVADDVFALAVAHGGRIEVHRITIDEATLAVTAERVHEETAPDAGDVHLAVGERSAEGTILALTWREGCAGANRVATRLLRLGDGGAAAVLTDVLESGSGLARRFPRAVWQPRANEWLVLWRAAQGAMAAQRLDPSGAPIGGVLGVRCGDAECTGLGGPPLLYARRAGALYALESPRFAESASLAAAAFGCGP